MVWVNNGTETRTFGLVVSRQNEGTGTFALSHALHAIGCGDGFVDQQGDYGPVESCDDGNGASSDGCSSSCQREAGWVCGTQMPSNCVQPPAGDVCASAETMQTGTAMYSMAGFSNECDMGGCSQDRWLTTTVGADDLLIINARVSAYYGYVRLWDVSNGGCNDATQLGTWWVGNERTQAVWHPPAGAPALTTVAVQLENPYGFSSVSFELDTSIDLPACGDGFPDWSGSFGQPESCDDGNTLDGDSCPSTCMYIDP
jgi:cysteine-rich repeat protein